jgi:hypothetical protein
MMKSSLAAVLFLLTFNAFAQALERWDVPLDPRDWKLAAEHREGRLTERVYVAPGESEYFWNEKLVVGHQRLAFSPDDYLPTFLEFLNEHCRPYKVKPLQQEQQVGPAAGGKATAASPEANSSTAASSSPRTACTSSPTPPSSIASPNRSARPGWPSCAKPN